MDKHQIYLGGTGIKLSIILPPYCNMATIEKYLSYVFGENAKRIKKYDFKCLEWESNFMKLNIMLGVAP